MNRTVALLVVGLTPDLLGPDTPNLSAFAKKGFLRPLNTITPAVTCSVQATFMTGEMPSKHGCVANGWYFRDLAQVLLWRQPEVLVRGEKIWDAAKKINPDFTCAKMFWWYNMYTSADWAVTPRPVYPADGRKLPDIWTDPPELRQPLIEKHGAFPLFNFWGPTADIRSTKWIADASINVFDKYNPTLTCIYLPHLDYNLQRLGPNHPGIKKDLRQADAVCGELIEHFEKTGANILIMSEYGITEVTDAVHINRELRKAGFLKFRMELGLEMLDVGLSDAFAMSDHQIAHVYINNQARTAEIKSLLEGLDGVETVLDENTKGDYGLDHPNSGELVAISKADRWFSYYFWLDDALAPDYARTVDIHRKPGYDPVELFVDPKLPFPKLKVGKTLLKKILGFRYLMDVIGFDTTLVKGSHGRPTDDPKTGPLIMGNRTDLFEGDDSVKATDIKELILKNIFNG